MLVPAPATDFLNRFLAARQLTRPTGQPLYTYKTSRSEHEQLRALLVRAPLTDSTAACFILFAAEWWRRQYSGGHWEWEPIFTDIQRPDWAGHSKRTHLMNNGCRYWQRQLFQHEGGHNSLLGTLFFESGLPVGILTNESYIRGLIIKSFAFLETYSTQRADTYDCIRDLASTNQLPSALNVDPFFDLIYKVIKALLHLKTTCQLGNQEQPLTYLNQHVPNWREHLPVRIDDHAGASAFLDSLLVDVAKAARQEVSKLGVTYKLIQTENEWTIKTTLHIPSGLYKPGHLQLDEETIRGFSNKVLIKISIGTTEQLIGYAFKNGNGDLSISGLEAATIPTGSYANSWQLLLTDGQTDHRATIDLPYADGLDPAMPWVFALEDREHAVLKGINSTRLSASRALVVCPTAFVVDAPNGAIRQCGHFSEHQTVYELSSSCMLRDEQDDQVYRIRLSEPTDDTFYVALHPQRNGHCLPFFQKQHAGIFLGFPRIRRVHKQGGFTLPSRDTIQYKTYQHKVWRSLTDANGLVGRFKIRSIGPEGDVLFSKEIAVLPIDFHVRFDAPNRRVSLRGTSDFDLSVRHDQPGLEVTISKADEGHQVDVNGNSQTPKLTMLLSTSLASDIKLHVPFPTASATFRDGAGNVMVTRQPIDLHALYGAELVLTNVSASQQTNRISLTLLDRHNPEAGTYTLTKTLKLPPFSGIDVSLANYRHDVERLFSFTNNLDAVIRVQHQSGAAVHVSQYTHQPTYNHQTKLVTLVGPTPVDPSIRLQAFPLAECFSTNLLVDLICGEAGWSFPDGHCTPGKWFCFSAKDSAASVRPSVATRADDIAITTSEFVDALHEATNHSFDDRQAVLIDLFDRMGSDVTNANWTTLDSLHDSTSHLPLHALDFWKALVKSTKGLVAFFLRSDLLMISKLTREYSVSWHSISVAVWLDGIRTYQASLPASVATLVIEQKVDELERSFSLGSLAQIIRMSLLDGTSSPEFQVCQHPFFIQPIIREELMGKQGLPGLIHRHEGHKFPTYLHQEIADLYNKLPSPVKQLLPDIPPHFKYIIPLIRLPVLLAYQSVFSDNTAIDLGGLHRHQMTQLIEFDETYVNLTYNLIQAYCWLTTPNYATLHGN